MGTKNLYITAMLLPVKIQQKKMKLHSIISDTRKKLVLFILLYGNLRAQISALFWIMIPTRTFLVILRFIFLNNRQFQSQKKNKLS